MKEVDFAFTIGYSGSDAVVDRGARSSSGRLSARELADSGQFKAAFARALFEEDAEAQTYVLTRFNDGNPAPCSSVEQLKRVLGVSGVPEGIGGIRAL